MLLPCQEAYKRVLARRNRGRVCRDLTNPFVVRFVTSVGRNEARERLLARAVDDEQLGGTAELEDAADGPGPADDRELAILAAEQSARAHQRGQPARVDEVHVREVDHERAG